MSVNNIYNTIWSSVIYLPDIYNYIFWITTIIWFVSCILPFKSYLTRKFITRNRLVNLLMLDFSAILFVGISYGLTLDSFSNKAFIPTYWVVLRIVGPAISVISLFIFHYNERHDFMKMFNVKKRWYHAF